MSAFTMAYTVLGGLGLFFYGMKSMSESLQSLAGDTIRQIISVLTSNRFLAVIVGCAVTMLVQSSSVSTVMVIGLVNAGLMSLVQAIGVIFGANIGTTITGWIISIKVGKYGLLLIGMGIFPALFGRTNRHKEIGRIFLGMGMIFFGLEIMSNAFKPLKDMPEFLEILGYFSGGGIGSLLASVVVGCLLTIVIQSSSAMLGITMALAQSGVIELNTAMALVLGENVGTTITAQLATVGGSVNAKRVAHAHSLFNILGVLALISIFPYYANFIEWLIPGEANFVDMSGARPNISVHIASSHTIFNVVATLLFIPFINQLAAIVSKLVPDEKVKEQTKLQVLGDPSDMIAATALVVADKELQKFKDIVDRMFNRVDEYLNNGSTDPRTLAKIKDYERITDNIQKEITFFILKLMENRLNERESLRAQALVRSADELESIADYLDKLATSKTRFCEKGAFDGDIREEFIAFYNSVRGFYDKIAQGLITGNFLDELLVKEEMLQLKHTSDELREKFLNKLTSDGLSPYLALAYSDMVTAAKKVRSHSMTLLQVNLRV